MNFSDLIKLILNVGSLAGLVAIIYQIHNNRVKRPLFQYTFESSHTETYHKDSLEFCDYHFSGLLRNKSLEPNSIVRFYLTVWNNKKRGLTRRFGFGIKEITDIDTKKKLFLPLYFQARQAYRVNIIFNFPLTGTQDDKLLKELMPVGTSGRFFLPKNHYEFLMEDTAGNLFDASNNIFNIRVINALWTLPNFSKKPFRYAVEIIRISRLVVSWRIEKFLNTIGFYK